MSREIPIADWDSFLEQFSQEHRAWIAEVESTMPENAIPKAATRRFLGARLNVQNSDAAAIELRFHRENDGQDTVYVSPQTLRAEETTEGAVQGLEIETRAGERLRVHFRGTVETDALLDGIAPGEVI